MLHDLKNDEAQLDYTRTLPKHACKGTKLKFYHVLKFFFFGKQNQWFKKWKCGCSIEGTTYYVPTILIVLASIWLLPKILAVPKSDILGFISSSNNTLLAFISLWMILSRESSCKYWRPLAIPLTMFLRLAQSRSLHLFGSTL